MKTEMIRACIDAGGPMFKIQSRGKVYEFEMNQFVGPIILNKRNGCPVALQPNSFLEAASLWCKQGQKVDENGLCIWFHEPEPITEHLGGRNFKIVGYGPEVRGQ